MAEPIRILIVEDQLTDAELAQREINRALAPCAFQRVETREAYLAALETFQPDLIVSDYSMPHFDGMTALKLALECAPLTPVIILTGSMNEDTAVACMKAGAVDYVIKEHMKRLGSAVLHALEEKHLRQERQRVEAALQASEAQLTGIIESAMDAIISINTEQRIILFNAAAEHMFGCPASEALGQPVERFIPERFRAAHRRHIRAFGQTGVTNRAMGVLGLVMGQRANGEEFPIEASISQIETGGTKLYTVILRDVTERKHVEAAARRQVTRTESLARISQLFAASAPDFGAVLDTVARQVCELVGDTCVIRLVSEDGQWLTPVVGCHPDPEALVPIGEILTTVARHGHQNPVDQRLENGRPILHSDTTPEQLRALIGPEVWPWLTGYPIYSVAIIPLWAPGQVIGMLGVARITPGRPYTDDDVNFLQDMADRVALAIANARLLDQVQRANAELERSVAERTADLRRTNAELAQAARAKDEFLASMSHELRTPLNAILTLSESLVEGTYGPLNDQQQKPLHTITESGYHLLNLINDILDLSKIEAGKMELHIAPIEVDLVCQASLRLVKQQAQQRHLRVSLHIDPVVTTLRADARRLKQMLVNLLSNAVKFTPEGGEIGLEVRGDSEAGVAHFTVWDTGIGIAPEHAQQLFRPFVQVDSGLSRQYGGTGLGLSLVYRMARMHGGSVAMVSTPGQGIRFTISMPWEGPGDRRILGPRRSVPVPNILQALIIEDSPTAAEQLARYLLELGARVVVYPAGEAALSKAIEVQPDVIVLDIQLPGLSGWEVLAQLKADGRTQAIPVIMVTVVDEPEFGLAQGAADYVVKPVTRSRLYEALQKALTSMHAANEDAQSSAPAQAPVLLLAEDNLANQSTYADYLSVKGYQVILAANGVEAIDFAREAQPDLILMDVQMPEMDGLEVMRRLRADPELCGIPIIAVTALAMPGDRERCLEAGANEYLTKPVSLKRLLQTIDAHLRRRRP